LGKAKEGARRFDGEKKEKEKDRERNERGRKGLAHFVVITIALEKVDERGAG
jgi:hypothetical protein